MNNHDDLLPRDKDDFERVEVLKRIEKETLIELIPELAEWLQDINWPIAIEISKLLLTVPEAAIPVIRNVLEGEDDLWKEWCLRYVVQELPIRLIGPLKADLERLAYRPTKGEELEGVSITAREILGNK